MDSTLVWVLLITAIAGIGGTGLGGVISSFIKRDSKSTVSLLLSFAGGVMLSVVCFDLVLGAINSETWPVSKSLPLTLLGIAFGFVLIAALNYVIDKNTNHEVQSDPDHPKTADDLDELIHSDHYAYHERHRHHDAPGRDRQLFLAGLIMAAAIALHNLPEGMVIGAAYVHSAGSLWSGSGLVLACVIGLHNIPEGMAVSVPLIAGGMKRSRAVAITAASGAPTVVGAAVGYLVGSLGEAWHILALAFASGAMLYVVFGELLPESILMWRSKRPAFAVLVGMLVGILIIYA